MILRRLNRLKIQKTLIKINRTKENSVFGVSDIYGVKLLTRLRLNFSHLNEHKFRHNVNDTISPICSCGAATETTILYLLPCRLYSVQRPELLDGVFKLDSTLQNSSENRLLRVLLYGSENFALNVNKEIIRLTTTQQTLNVDSTLIYVEIMSRRRSTWYPRWFNVDLSTLIHR